MAEILTNENTIARDVIFLTEEKKRTCFSTVRRTTQDQVASLRKGIIEAALHDRQTTNRSPLPSPTIRQTSRRFVRFSNACSEYVLKRLAISQVDARYGMKNSDTRRDRISGKWTGF